MTSKTLTVLGGGSFGTVIASIAADNGFNVRLWMRNEESAQSINTHRVNQKYLPDLTLNEGVFATTDLEFALKDSRLLFFSIPSKSFRQVLEQSKPYVHKDQLLISTTKGIEPGTFNLMSDVLRSVFPENERGVLSGPNLAKEIAKREPAATVIASDCDKLRLEVQEALGCSYFRVYASNDRQGVELGGTLKNIYAMMSGIIAAKQMGENTAAMLITRSLAEMGRFAHAQGANPLTFLGLAGVGDLIATCSSPLSRNYRVGYAIGEGKDYLQAAEELGEVAEGVNTLAQIKRIADEQDIYMPLVQGLHKIIHEHIPLDLVVNQLMTSQQKTDVEFVLAE